MGYVKRQVGRQHSKMALGTLNKSGACSRTELERGAYVLRYGGEWVQQWWTDHPGVVEVAGETVQLLARSKPNHRQKLQ